MLPAPQWPVPANVRAACSTRAGGVSPAPYDTLNLGDHVGDAEAAVAENRRRYAQALGARPVFLKQVHGTGVLRLDAATPHGAQADACWTRERGLACTMMVADCLPVLLADRAGTVVGAAHCGWRGLAQGVLEALCQGMELAPQGALAWLGPCIGPQAFEVGPEVRTAFVAGDAGAAACFRPHGDGKFLADLQALARRRLAALGITQVHGNDGTPRWCTVTDASRFFSHRRDRVSGRLAASVWLD
jgi:polyphenol oxidase